MTIGELRAVIQEAGDGIPLYLSFGTGLGHPVTEATLESRDDGTTVLILRADPSAESEKPKRAKRASTRPPSDRKAAKRAR